MYTWSHKLFLRLKPKTIRKVRSGAYRWKTDLTATAAARGCAWWLLHHFLLLPRQLLLFFFLPLAAGLPLSLAALDFPLVSFVFPWFFLKFSFVFLFFLFFSLYFLLLQQANELLSSFSPHFGVQLAEQVLNNAKPSQQVKSWLSLTNKLKLMVKMTKMSLSVAISRFRVQFLMFLIPVHIKWADKLSWVTR